MKNSRIISPMSPKLSNGCPWTSQMALRRQAFPFMPILLSISSAKTYSKALSPPWNALFGGCKSLLWSLLFMNPAIKSANAIPAFLPFMALLSKTGGNAPYGFSLSVNPNLSKSTVKFPTNAITHQRKTMCVLAVFSFTERMKKSKSIIKWFLRITG